MPWQSPTDAMPWVGLYIGVASLVCTLAMAADVIQGFRQRKLWFPCRFFTINAASTTLIAIAMKLPVDLSFYNVSVSGSGYGTVMVSLVFLVTMLANSLPSLGLMDGKELLMNIIAMGILLVTIIVNSLIGFMVLEQMVLMTILSYSLLLPFSVALTVVTSRRILELQYKELRRLDSNGLEINFSYKELLHHVKRYWMMAETGNPQFVIACSTISCASGFLCLFFASYFISLLIGGISDLQLFSNDQSDYKWSVAVIYHVQSFGIVVGCIAPTFRCLTIISYFNLSRKWSMNQLNMFRVEKHWTRGLQQWKCSDVGSYIPCRRCRKVFHILKNMILNLVLVLQIMVLVICKIICLIPMSILIFLTSCYCICYSVLVKRFKKEQKGSNSNVRSEMDEYTGYVLQIGEDTKLSKRILENAFNSITRLLHESSEKQPNNLLKLLRKSTGFNGVVVFDNDQVPPLHPEETQNCWSLVVVTLTAISLALPNIGKGHAKELLASMIEGLELVSHIEESLNANGELVKVRKTARLVWTEVEVYSKWLQINLQKKARKQETSKEILEWLSDEAVKTSIQFKSCKNKTGSLDDSLHNFIAASSMFKISQSILLNCHEQENWPTDEELFKWISTIIADLLCACFTNLPRVIKMKCHHKAIEKREESIKTAALILGRSKDIMNILKVRQLPKMDVDSMAYIDAWHAMLKSRRSNACPSLPMIHSGCLTSGENSLGDSLV